MDGTQILTLGLGLQAPWKLKDQHLDTTSSPHRLELYVGSTPRSAIDGCSGFPDSNAAGHAIGPTCCRLGSTEVAGAGVRDQVFGGAQYVIKRRIRVDGNPARTSPAINGRV